MACHEIAALRLGLMNIIGIENETEKQHEINEIGKEALAKPGPIQSLSKAESINLLKQYYGASLADLEQKVATASSNDPKLSYYRSLLVLTKKVEMDLNSAASLLENLYRDLDEIHDFVHEIYPAK